MVLIREQILIQVLHRHHHHQQNQKEQTTFAHAGEDQYGNPVKSAQTEETDQTQESAGHPIPADEGTTQTPEQAAAGISQGGLYVPSDEPIRQAQRDIAAGVTAERTAAKTEAQAYGEAATNVKNAQIAQAKLETNYKTKSDQLLSDMQDQKIDPDRYFKNQDTGSRIASAIGLILSGAGLGVTGQPNMALGMINKSIDNDIQAQMNDQSKTMNLYKMNREALGDSRQAALATEGQMLTIAKYKAMQAQATAKGPEAAARMAQTNLQLNDMLQKNARMRSLLDMNNMPTQGQPAQTDSWQQS